MISFLEVATAGDIDIIQSKIANINWAYLIKRFLIAAIILIVGLTIIKLITNWLERFLKKKQSRRSISRLAVSSLRIFLYLMLGISLFDYFGLETTSLIALIGSVGIAIGLALQGSLGDLASGILLAVIHPFQSGDYVYLGDNRDELLQVLEISFFQTSFRNNRGFRVFVPNSKLTQKHITNISVEAEIMAEVKFSVSYDTPIEETRQVVLKALDMIETTSSEKSVVFPSNLGESGIDFIARSQVKVEDYLATISTMRTGIKEALDKAGIEIPYPQLDVRMRQNSDPK